MWINHPMRLKASQLADCSITWRIILLSSLSRRHQNWAPGASFRLPRASAQLLLPSASMSGSIRSTPTLSTAWQSANSMSRAQSLLLSSPWCLPDRWRARPQGPHTFPEFGEVIYAPSSKSAM